MLESANIKLGSVASDVLGVSGRKMIEALVAGKVDAVVHSSAILEWWLRHHPGTSLVVVGRTLDRTYAACRQPLMRRSRQTSRGAAANPPHLRASDLLL